MTRFAQLFVALLLLTSTSGCMTLIGAAVGGAVNGRQGARRGAAVGAELDGAMISSAVAASRTRRQRESKKTFLCNGVSSQQQQELTIEAWYITDAEAECSAVVSEPCHCAAW